ncbi:hypothetical protein NUW54_g12813 [Trametes sanguinea]|uniref:Uncharacterized protein n=1 Tax=Trametes sanguinea TaxID=158606 RepID=A0ACC1MTB1_9APHY|nr:hypothetical protein NUW54_g12813 [Trametes sanguinea]
MKQRRTLCRNSFSSSLRRRSNSPDFLNLRTASELWAAAFPATTHAALFDELSWFVLIRRASRWTCKGKMRAGGKPRPTGDTLSVARSRCSLSTLSDSQHSIALSPPRRRAQQQTRYLAVLRPALGNS